MKIHSTGKYSNFFLKDFYLHKWRKLYIIQPSLVTIKRTFVKIIAGCMGRESWHAINKLFNLPGFGLLLRVVIILNSNEPNIFNYFQKLYIYFPTILRIFYGIKNQFPQC